MPVIFRASGSTALKTGISLLWKSRHEQKSLSVNTAYGAVLKYRLKRRHANKKTYVNMIEKCICLLWAKAKLTWTEAKWKTDLWSDKLKFLKNNDPASSGL